MSVADHERAIEQQLRELTITNELIRSLTSSSDLPAVLRLVLARLKMLTQAEGLSFLMYDSENDELIFSVAETLQENTWAGQSVPPGGGAAYRALHTGRSVMVDDPHDQPELDSVMEGASGFVSRGLISVPLLRAGAVVGVVEVVNRYDGLRFTEEDVAAIEAVVERAAADIDMGADLKLIRPFLSRVAATVPAEVVMLLSHDPANRMLVVAASRIVQGGLVAGIRLRTDQGIAGWVARNRQAVRLDDVVNDPRYYRGVESQTRLTPRGMLCVPIVSRGKLLGVIQAINKIDGTPFTEHDLHLAQSLADHAALAIENVSLYRQTQIAAVTDDLTELRNTRYFNKVLPEILAHSPQVSLLVLDLDNFKAIVDTHGHLVGSRTIRQLGQLIGKRIRPDDIAARFGGDEFVVILPDTDSQTAAAIAESLRAAIEQTHTLAETTIDISSVTASVGTATFPDHAATAEELFKAADTAMYRAKRRSKNAVISAA